MFPRAAPIGDDDRAKYERPNGLDIWRHGDADRKVLDVIWTDGTMPIIVTYWGGAWEHLLKQARV